MEIIFKKHTNKYRLFDDIHCFTVCKWNRKTEEWTEHRYFSELKYVARYLLRIGLLSVRETNNLEEAILKAEKSIFSSISQAFTDKTRENRPNTAT